MKAKINHALAIITNLFVSFASGAGIGVIICKILGEDAWSWNGWSNKHKIIYHIATTLLLIPAVMYMSYAQICISDRIDEEFEDEI